MRHADSVRERTRTLVFIAALGATVLTGTAAAQDTAPAAAPTTTAEATELDLIEVTGSRIMREEYYANSPVSTVTRDQINAAGDVTLEQYLQTLPQINPTFTTTSNNPGNGKANIDLRALGSNRNLVLVDGRRPMPSSSGMTIDLNAVPVALIDRVEILTGGAGAVYGADAISGAVNIITKKKYQGVDLRSSWRDSEDEHDSMERSLSVAVGQNFAGGRGNFTFGADYADRERMIKKQREFATFATSTTGSLPEGLLNTSTSNPYTQAQVDAIFGSYDPGYTPGDVVNNQTLIGFNTDGTLFSRGVFNSPLDVVNYRYPVDTSVNQRLFPDFYSYNFDEINILQLPLERYSASAKTSYEIFDNTEAFAHFSWTNYETAQALAPTPAGGSTRCNVDANADGVPDNAARNRAVSPLVTCGSTVSNLIIPWNNPFTPADLDTLLASRTGDDPSLVGSGATEPFRIGYRFLPAGLREQVYDNTVRQTTLGLSGDFAVPTWRYSAYWSTGKTVIETNILGNINVQRFQNLLNTTTVAQQETQGCPGGFNPFGRNPISAECLNFLKVPTADRTTFEQDIWSGYITGDLGNLPAGGVSLVFGAEYRKFEYNYGRTLPTDETYFIGFNTSDDAAGSNLFRDVYAEMLIPILKDLPGAKALDLGLGYRTSTSEFTDVLTGETGGSNGDTAYKLDLSWAVVDAARARISYQRAVRAPNFGELFDGGGGFPQFFDPCGITSYARTGRADSAQVRQLCIDTGIAAGAVDAFVPAPGGQILVFTNGNTALEPETGTTFTVGAVLESQWGGMAKDLTASIDYYSIKVTNPILAPDPNLIIAQCYNYFGTNPGYSATLDPNCDSVTGTRTAGGGDLSVGQVLFNSQSADGSYPAENGGLIQTSGVDIQVDYGINWADLGAPAEMGRIKFNLLINHLLNFEQQDASYLPVVDYTGTAGYFGQGNTGAGGSLPEWRWVLNTGFMIGPASVDIRTRYIGEMENRAARQFPGERFTAPDAIMYWDVGAGYQVTSGLLLRVGMNNVLDEDPPTYAPNVQSGTDPSMYDIVGRSVLAQIRASF